MISSAQTPPKKPPQTDKQKRLSAALRANIARRKVSVAATAPTGKK
jgi:hypothetical protein